MKASSDKTEYDLREKIVCLLLSNPLHKPSIDLVENKGGFKFYADCSTIKIAEDLCFYINNGSGMFETPLPQPSEYIPKYGANNPNR
jgi:hypothetical protein